MAMRWRLRMDLSVSRPRVTLRAALAVSTLVALTACGTSSGGSGTVLECISDAQCDNGATCVDGYCEGGVEPAELDSLPDPDAEPDAPEPDVADEPDVVDAGDGAFDADADPNPGGLGLPCDDPTDCESGICIRRGDERVCSIPCAGVCPDGWSCEILAGAGGDVSQICVPIRDVLCEPCIDDFDCGSLGALCLPLRDGTWCGTPCELQVDCPEGFVCDQFTNPSGGGTVGQCVPRLEICGDCLDEDGDFHGVGPGCLGTDCNDADQGTYLGAAESCDRTDNDCDSLIDEDFDLNTDPRHCGACGNECSVLNGEAYCFDAECRVRRCSSGWYDLNGRYADGCEYECTPNPETGGVEACNGLDDDCDGDVDETFDLARDDNNCGECGNRCEIDGAEAACIDAECRIATCEFPYADCDGFLESGCETNTRVDLEHCGGCGRPCDPANASGVCASGVCGIFSCAGAWADCNGQLSDGCEVPLDRDPANCDACGRVCELPNAVAGCAARACTVASCLGQWSDCNADPIDGCEANLDTNAANCGRCGRVCEAENGTGVCVAGSCRIGACEEPWADCVGGVEDGCETNLDTSIDHCGACGQDCIAPNSTMTCEDGACVVLDCDEGWEDCDGIAENGCEVNLDTSLAHCGACDRACARDNADAVCIDGACELLRCAADFGNCDGSDANGCEEFLRFNGEHCGACSNACERPNAATACNDRTCIRFGCQSGWADCNTTDADGCETDIWFERETCGSCITSCSADNSEEFCSFGICQLGDCAEGFGNCDGNPTNGCETSLVNNNANCGACGQNCNRVFANGAGRCDGLACELVGCTGTYSDCNRDAADGCEVDLATNTANCGACGRTCELANAFESCGAGLCLLLACEGTYDNCNRDPADGCEVDTATSTAHCGACGSVCSFPNATGRCSGGRCSFGGCSGPYWNLDRNVTNGCEYACAYVGPNDPPDLSFSASDANCDGVDGNAASSVFVAPTGSDLTGTGTIDAPVATITRGIQIAQSSATRRDVLIAAGTYVENITLVAGVNLYGGYTIAGTYQWSRAPRASAPTVIQAPGRIGIAAANISTPTLVQNLVITSAAATSPGQSSYGARVINSPGVTLEAVTIRAGAGANGAGGTTGSNGSAGGVGVDGQIGCDGCSGNGNGGSGGSSSCGNTGGSGGRGGYGDNTGSSGSRGSGSSGGSGGGGGRSYDNLCIFGCDRGGTGGTGGPGGSGSTGGNGAGGANMGSVSGNEWTAGTGAAGSPGTAGSGGGGGGGGGADACCNSDRGGGGGGGGGGGCGGAGGTAGRGGGGSIGVLAIGAGPTIRSSTIETAAGGRGGDGGGGGAGGAGGPPGSGGGRADDGGFGGPGGSGGTGGRGGCGGGGGGGAAVGIMTTGGSVVSTGNTFNLGSAGAGGGGCGGAGAAGMRNNVVSL